MSLTILHEILLNYGPSECLYFFLHCDSTVYLCRRLADQKLVIIKQIPVETMTKEERQAALNEVKVLSMLDHPNIIEYYENFLEDKALMIVMEYAQGGDFSQIMSFLHTEFYL